MVGDLWRNGRKTMKSILFLCLWGCICLTSVLGDDPSLGLSMSTDDVQQHGSTPSYNNNTAISFIPGNMPYVNNKTSDTATGIMVPVGDIEKDLEAAHDYTETFSKAFESVATIAEFFGPEGAAVAAVFKLASGLFGDV